MNQGPEALREQYPDEQDRSVMTLRNVSIPPKVWLSVAILIIGSWSLPGSSQAQPSFESVVAYTEAKSYRIGQHIRLPGTVRSRLVSTIASEVSGLVIEFPVSEGQAVKKGEILARLRPENLELRLREARAQLKEDDARLQLAETTMARTRELLAKGAVSQQDVDDRESDFNSLERRSERLRAIIAQLEDDLERTVIRAPFSGIVVQELAQLGEWVDVGGPVVELMSLEELEVAVDLPERYYDAVKPGTRAVVTFDALSGVRVTGVTRVVIPVADTQARTFPVLLRIPNLDGRIGVGMLSNVQLSVGRSYAATIIPKDAITVQGQGQFVFILDEANVVKRTKVRSGAAVGDWVEVKDAIQPGQRVVTRGNERLRDGQKVRANAAEVHYALP